MEKDMMLNGVRSRIYESGKADGQPIVLMHGWGCQASTLASIEKVAGETCRVINVDFPGFGQSDEPAEVWGVADYSRWLEDLINQLGLERPTLLGHSFGGRVAIHYASSHPVGKIILVDAAGVKPRRGLKYYVKVYSFKLGKWLTKMTMSKEKAEASIAEQRKRRGSADYANSTPQMRAIMSRVVNEDLRHLMPKIQAPTLLIWGENDTATPMRDARIMEKLIPGAGLVSFSACGHYSFLDNPRQFAAVLRSFLAS